jgi:hypothetical protein
MRACYSSALALAAAVVFSFGLAGHVSAQCNACGDGPHGCQLHGRHGCGGACKGHHKKIIEGKDRGYNCGCNGSYNYPVPPLYTYHWPGMYKAERMTDYHSPWRFPPLKPFPDEEVPGAPAAMTVEPLPSELQPITALVPITSTNARLGEPELMSTKLLKSFR